jgi:hypothetical protein
VAGMIRKILRAAVAQPWDYVGEGAPHDWEIRMSPDGRHIAVWEPGNEPWFVIDTAAVKGQWTPTEAMEKHAADWIPFLPLNEDE